MHASPTDGDPTFGCDLKTDELYTRNFIDDAKKKFNFSSILLYHHHHELYDTTYSLDHILIQFPDVQPFQTLKKQ